MRRFASLLAGAAALAAVAAVTLHGIAPAAPPASPICAQDPDGLLPELTGRARPLGPEVPLIARDASATVIAICVDGLAAHPPLIRDGDMTLDSVGGFAESYDGAPGVLQYLVFPPTTAETVEVLLQDEAPVPVSISPAANTACPPVAHPDIEVLSCGWLVRGVWRTDLRGAEVPNLVDLLAWADGTAVPAYVFGFAVHDDGIDVEFALPAWATGADVLMRIDTLQRDFRVLHWTGNGVARLSP